MEWYESEVADLERRLHEQPPSPGAVLFYGSSSIRLWTSAAADLDEPRLVNAGFGGSTLEACAWYFDRLVAPWKPSVLTLYAGDNDLGDGQSVERTLLFFDAFLWRFGLRCPHTRLAVLSVKPSPARSHLQKSIARVNRGIAQRLAAMPDAVYVDVHGPMLDRNGDPRPELYAADGLHLSPAGYDLWTQILRARRDEIFTVS
ncbi:MAG: GDSL family lipase [Acidobacteria bacterium]|nr:GDSL family lipase [Acidobacteriota bacterium]